MRFGLLFVLLPVILFCGGCGTSRRQYAINEALLIDQARILEDEIYRTRYELQYLQMENEHLRNTLQKEKSKKTPDDEQVTADQVPVNVSRGSGHARPLRNENGTPAGEMLPGSRRSDSSLEIPNQRPESGVPATVPLSQSFQHILVIPKTSATLSEPPLLNSPASNNTNTESLPSQIVVPRSQQGGSMIPVSQPREVLPGLPTTHSGQPSSIIPSVYRRSGTEWDKISPAGYTNSSTSNSTTSKSDESDWSPFVPKNHDLVSSSDK